MTVLLLALSVVTADPVARASSPEATQRTTLAPQGVLLDFTATWCGPCQQMAPIVSRLERQGFPVRKVDLDQNQGLAKRYGVTSIPCFILVVNDREVTRIVGQTTEAELRRLCNQIPRSDEPEIVAEGRGGATRPGPARILPVTNEPPARPKETAEAPKRKGLLPNLFGRKEKEDRSNPFDDVETIRGNNDATSEPESPIAGDPLSSSVRIKVRDAKGLNFGTGSIIVSKPGRTLVLTCGHLFRGLTEESTIEVEAFLQGKVRKYQGTLVTYDEKADVGLITIPTEGSLPTVSVAPMTTPLTVGDELISVGCSAGEVPSRMAAQVTGLNRYKGSDNIECTGLPVPGRSGGGLFNAQGEVVGVCWAAYEEEKRGIYTGLKPIYALLQKAKVLPGNPGAEADSTDAAFASDAGPKPRGRATPSEKPTLTRDADSLGDAGAFGEALRDSGAASMTGDMPDESLVRDAEVVCIIRPKDTKLGTRVVIMHRASNRFLSYLQGEWKAPPKPTSARFPFDPTMNLTANLIAAPTRTEVPRPASIEAPTERFERYRRSAESR